MSISKRQPGTWCSLFIAGTVIPRANHHFLTADPIDVTQSGNPLQIVILPGTESFSNADGEPATPVGFISKSEFFTLRTMLECTTDGGELIERTLPTAWEDIDAMVIAMREAAVAESTELGNEQEQQP